MRSAGLARLFDPRLLGRHQTAAAVATCIDFATMISLVELSGAQPAVAAMLGAAVGGITNFLVTRRWAFASRHSGSVGSQAVRYAAVSFGGALLNGALVELALLATPLSYLVARTLGSALVSVFYTYPLHTRVVFRVAELAPVSAVGESGGEAPEAS